MLQLFSVILSSSTSPQLDSPVAVDVAEKIPSGENGGAKVCL
jgi:hypothetical protein